MQRGDPMELNFEIKGTNAQSLKSRWVKWGHLPSYHVFKMSEIANFLYFLLITEESLSQFEQYI